MGMLIYLLCMVAVFTQYLGSEQFSIDPKLLAAIAKVESNGNSSAIGDKHLKNKAYGVYQIRKPYFEDAVKFNASLHQGSFPDNVSGKENVEFAKNIVESYMNRYATVKRLGRQPTNEDIARIHNGGPNGYKKNGTLEYWKKVKRAYDAICQEERDVARESIGSDIRQEERNVTDYEYHESTGSGTSQEEKIVTEYIYHKATSSDKSQEERDVTDYGYHESTDSYKSQKERDMTDNGYHESTESGISREERIVTEYDYHKNTDSDRSQEERDVRDYEYHKSTDYDKSREERIVTDYDYHKNTGYYKSQEERNVRDYEYHDNTGSGVLVP